MVQVNTAQTSRHTDYPVSAADFSSSSSDATLTPAAARTLAPPPPPGAPDRAWGGKPAMASSSSQAAAAAAERKRTGRDDADACGSGALPHDALYEILLRLPARELCRLRAVGRPWRALTSDPVFVRDHAARHAAPLLATTFGNDGGDESCGVSIVDLSTGDVVKRIRTDDRDFRLQRTHLDLVCMVGGRHPLAVAAINPATGDILGSSQDFSQEYEDLLKRRYVSMDSCAFGKVPSTGEYKAFRFLHVGSPVGSKQLCEVMTLDGSGRALWRAKPGPPAPVCASNKMKSVVIDGVVYFLFDFLNPRCKYLKMTMKPGSIASFNLATEEWMPALNGPEPVSSFYEEGNMITISGNPEIVEHLSITNLNGSLVTVHVVRRVSMDLWFLVDHEEGIWVKKYSICYRHDNRFAYPLLVLDDERIIFIIQSKDLLRSYDPKTDTYTDMLQLEDYRSIGVYTGSLLS